MVARNNKIILWSLQPSSYSVKTCVVGSAFKTYPESPASPPGFSSWPLLLASSPCPHLGYHSHLRTGLPATLSTLPHPTPPHPRQSLWERPAGGLLYSICQSWAPRCRPSSGLLVPSRPACLSHPHVSPSLQTQGPPRCILPMQTRSPTRTLHCPVPPPETQQPPISVAQVSLGCSLTSLSSLLRYPLISRVSPTSLVNPKLPFWAFPSASWFPHSFLESLLLPECKPPQGRGLHLWTHVPSGPRRIPDTEAILGVCWVNEWQPLHRAVGVQIQGQQHNFNLIFNILKLAHCHNNEFFFYLFQGIISHKGRSWTPFSFFLK